MASVSSRLLHELRACTLHPSVREAYTVYILYLRQTLYVGFKQIHMIACRQPVAWKGTHVVRTFSVYILGISHTHTVSFSQTNLECSRCCRKAYPSIQYGTPWCLWWRQCEWRWRWNHEYRTAQKLSRRVSFPAWRNLILCYKMSDAPLFPYSWSVLT